MTGDNLQSIADHCGGVRLVPDYPDEAFFPVCEGYRVFLYRDGRIEISGRMNDGVEASTLRAVADKIDEIHAAMAGIR